MNTDSKDVRADLRETFRAHLNTRRSLKLSIVVQGCLLTLAAIMTFDIDKKVGVPVFALLLVLGLACIVAIQQVHLMVFSFNRLGPVRWHCPHCDKSLTDRIIWICGHCDFRNAKRVVFEKCARCDSLAASYQCPHCSHLTYFNADHNGRLPARDAQSVGACLKSDAELAIERAKELSDREHEIKAGEHARRLLEIERNQLELQIEKVRLQRTLNQPEPRVVDPQQARIKWMAEMVEQAEASCRTLAETVEREAKLHAEIDAMGLSKEMTEQSKEIFSRVFERIRLKLQLDAGGDIGV